MSFVNYHMACTFITRREDSFVPLSAYDNKCDVHHNVTPHVVFVLQNY